MSKSPLLVLASFLLFALSTGALPAQDDVRSVQEELRRRDLYFGNVDGRDSAELQEATKRYQKRKGFAATGHPDRDTLRSLGLVPRSENESPPRELDWPTEPVLPSDEKVDPIVIADALSEETGIAATAIVPKKRRGPAASSTKRSEIATAAAAVPVVDSNQKTAASSPVITSDELLHFASDYFAAMGSNDIKRQLKFYADNVEYYRNGKIDRRIIEQTLRRYQIRWPKRRYKMGPQIRYSHINSRGEIVMTFPVSFTLKDGKRTVKGQTNNRLSISAATLDPRITSISEERIRR
jgi:hypothetical protein